MTRAAPGRDRALTPLQPTDDAVVIDKAARIAVLERELAHLRQQQRDEDDARLLRAIGRAIGAALFTVADLREHATIDPELREALRGRRPKQLGKFFARVVDRDVQGLYVRRIKLVETGWVWQVDFHEVLVDRA